MLGKDVFRAPPKGVTYLGTEVRSAMPCRCLWIYSALMSSFCCSVCSQQWALNPVVRGDIVVSHFLDSVGGYRHRERRDRLLEILDVDLDWYVSESLFCRSYISSWD